MPTVIRAGSAIQYAHHCPAEKRLHAVASYVPFSSGNEILEIIVHRESPVVYLTHAPMLKSLISVGTYAYNWTWEFVGTFFGQPHPGPYGPSAR